MTENNVSVGSGITENNTAEEIRAEAVKTEEAAPEQAQAEQPGQKAEPKPPGPFGHGGVTG